MVIIKHIAEHIKEFSGNILLSLNPVEENLHTGIIEGIDVLEQIKSEFGLRYVLAINNDYHALCIRVTNISIYIQE